MPNCVSNTSITSLLSGSPAETALCNWSRLTFFNFSDLAIKRYSVGVQQSTLIASSSIRLKYVSRSEEHTSELQSRFDLVCRLLLEKKNKLYYTRLFVYFYYVID